MRNSSIEKSLASGVHGAVATTLDQSRWIKRNLVSVRIYDYLVEPQLKKLRKAWGFSTTKAPDTSSTQNAASPQVARTDPDPLVLENYLLVLTDFLNLIRESGATPVFIIQATSKPDAKYRRLTGYSRAGASTAIRLGARVIDAQELVDAYQGNPAELFAPSGVHYSDSGAGALAGFIYNQLFE